MILAVDQGTTGTTCLVVDPELRVVGRGYREIAQSYPRPGWVEHDPDEIWRSVVDAAADAVAAARLRPDDISAVGITNQRETAVLWERSSGRPAHPAIVWQDRRTAEACRRLPSDLIRERTGLVPDPYFSATKLRWLLDHAGPAAGRAFGTIDSWLVWRMTGGAVHVTDRTNASRTMLYGLERGDWDDDLLEVFAVDRALLPAIAESSGVVGEADLLGAAMPIAGIAGDQQAALFGQGCIERGSAKVTYGTGSFVLVHTGDDFAPAPYGLLRTAAAGRSAFALEGSVFVAGAAIQWLRDGLGVLGSAAESEALAASVDSTGGVSFVPALTGLGSPYWDAGARGLITGLTRGTTRAHLVRAALEAIAFQVADVLDAAALAPPVLRADGGAAANGWLMQFQADLLGVPLEVAAECEMTAIGAAGLAGTASGVWESEGAFARRWRGGARYEPRMSRDEAADRLAGWRAAVERVRTRDA